MRNLRQNQDVGKRWRLWIQVTWIYSQLTSEIEQVFKVIFTCIYLSISASAGYKIIYKEYIRYINLIRHCLQNEFVHLALLLLYCVRNNFFICSFILFVELFKSNLIHLFQSFGNANFGRFSTNLLFVYRGRCRTIDSCVYAGGSQIYMKACEMMQTVYLFHIYS